MTPREGWTDQRLDDLNKTVDDGFARADRKMDEGFARADKKMDDGFARLDKKIDDGLARVDKKIDDGLARLDQDMRELRGEIKGLRGEMTRTIYGAVVVIVAAIIGNNALL